jgi:hypothetical protein
MSKLIASATFCVGLTLLATQAEAHRKNPGVANTQPEYVRLAEVCALVSGATRAS